MIAPVDPYTAIGIYLAFNAVVCVIIFAFLKVATDL